MAPWDDVHVRRAIAYALNGADIITANGGFATPVSTLISPQSLDTIAPQAQVNTLLKSVPLYPYNVAKAKAELAESAYPKGFKATLLEYPGAPVTSARSSPAVVRPTRPSGLPSTRSSYRGSPATSPTYRSSSKTSAWR